MLSVRARVAIVTVAGLAALAGVLQPAVAALDPTTPAAMPVANPAPLANATDQAEADRLERFIDWHIWNRQVYEIEYASNNRDPYEVVDGQNAGERYPGMAHITDTTDSGLWTGTYLAALAFKYQVAGSYLRRPNLSSKERAYWAAQRISALWRARPIIEQYHLKINISKWWTAPAPDPTKTNPAPDGNGNIETGVAPFPGGEPGLLFRTCIPSDAPDRLSFYKKDDGSWAKDTIYGPILWDPDGDGAGPTYYCEDGTSRDTYAGTTFGLITAFDLFGDDLGQAELGGSLRQQVGNDLMLLTDYLVRHGWSTPRPHSKVSTKNDLSSFYSPLFLYTPGAKVHMAQLARHVADAVGTPVEKAKFDALWQEEANGDDPFEAFSTELDAADKLSQYYKWNLGHLIAFDVIRLEPDPTERARIKQGIAVMDASTRTDENAHFEAITYSMTGDTARRDAAITHLRQWRGWRARYEGPTTAPYQTQYNSQSCTAADPPEPGKITCVAQGFKTMGITDPTGAEHTTEFIVPPTPSGPSAPDMGNDCNGTFYPRNCRAKYPIAIADRTPTDFLWQRSPVSLDGDRKATHESQGIDYLLPYWMLRYYTEVTQPANEPFPPFYGPYWK